MVAIELLCARKCLTLKERIMKLFKQSYQVYVLDSEIKCKVVLESVPRLSCPDIASLTNGVLPYVIRFWYAGSKKRWHFDYYLHDGEYKRMCCRSIRISYGRDVNGRVTLWGDSRGGHTDFGVVDVGINTKPEKIVLYGVKGVFGSYRFESSRESAVSTHKITITPEGYTIVGLGKDRYCRILDKASEYYGKLFSDVADKDILWSYYWRYRKKRCIDMDALASALGKSKMGGTSSAYEPEYICED